MNLSHSLSLSSHAHLLSLNFSFLFSSFHNTTFPFLSPLTDKKNSKKFELSTLEANKRNKSAKVAEEKLEAAEVAKKDFIDRKNKAITAGEEEEETAAAGFANLGELKNIFYKEVRDCPC